MLLPHSLKVIATLSSYSPGIQDNDMQLQPKLRLPATKRMLRILIFLLISY